METRTEQEQDWSIEKKMSMFETMMQEALRLDDSTP